MKRHRVEKSTGGFRINRKGGFPFHTGKCHEAMDNKDLALEYFIESAEIRKSAQEAGINDEGTLDSVQNVLRLAKELGKENELPEWILEFKLNH
jgi:hypothetical protein